jgi:DHA3 family macrolide efflux protein-like MFS transporter
MSDRIQPTWGKKSHSMWPFFTIWTGQAISVFGSALVQFALIWYLTVESRSAIVLAFASLVGLLPRVLLGPFIGALADRWNRRFLMQAADGLTAVVTMGLAALFYLDVVQVWHIYVMLFAASLGQTIHKSTFTASTTLMVPKSELTRVGGLNQLLQGATLIFAPPVGALLIGVLPIQAILAIDIATAVFAVTLLFFIHVPQPERTSTKKRASVWQDTVDGFRYIWTWPGLAMLSGVSMTLNFMLSPAFSMLPLIVTEHFRGGAFQLGWLESGFGAGMLAGGVALGVWGGFKSRVYTMLMGTGALGVMMIIIGGVPANLIFVAIAAMFVAGVGLALGNGTGMALMQGIVDPDMQGRVFATQASLGSLMTPLGLMLAGPFAETFGARTWMLFAGIGITLIDVLILFIPVALNIERQRHPKWELAEAEHVYEAVPSSS